MTKKIDANLVVISGAKPAKLPLRLPTVIGRGEDAQLKVKQHLVSRKHCEIFQDELELRIRDLGSSNGTIVNGNRIEGDFCLSPGDELSLGNIKLCVVFKPLTVSGEETVPMKQSKRRPSDPQLEETTDFSETAKPAASAKQPAGKIQQKKTVTSASNTSASKPSISEDRANIQHESTQRESIELGGSAVLSYEDLEDGSFIAIDMDQALPSAVESTINLDVDSEPLADESQIRIDLDSEPTNTTADDSQLHDFLKKMEDQ